MKPVAKYEDSFDNLIAENMAAIVKCVSHPNQRLNGEVVRTSTVLKYDKSTGVFETKNTIYELA